jgi:hypothetical protein
VEVVPTVLFVLFAIFTAVGMFFALLHWRGRTAAVAGAVATLLFFGLLLAAVLFAMRSAGLAP